MDFQGAVRSALLARWSGAPIAYGSEQPRENAASMFYTRNVLLPANGTHVVEQALALAQSVTASSFHNRKRRRNSRSTRCGDQGRKPHQ